MRTAVRLALFSLAAAQAVACLPEGPEEYDGPTYDIAVSDRPADASTSSLSNTGNPASTPDAGAQGTATPDASQSQGGATTGGGNTGSGVDSGTSRPDAGGGTATDAGGGAGTDSGAGTGADAGAVSGGSGLQKCAFDLTTASPPGQYASSYVAAVWVQKSDGKIARTLARHGLRRGQYLTKYEAARGVPKAAIDVTTSATLKGAHTFNLNWDLKDPAGAGLPSGNYTLRVETTSNNGAGPVVDLPFTLGATPVDQSPANSGNVTAVHVSCN
jgi:hypothetical protein